MPRLIGNLIGDWRGLLSALMCAATLFASPPAQAQQAAVAPEVSLRSVDSIALQGATAILDLTLNLRNTSGLALPLQKLRFQLQFNGLDVAQGVSTAPVTIAAQQQAQVPVQVDVDSATLLSLIATLPSDGTVHYVIKGTAEIGQTMLQIPFTHSGAVQLVLQ
ncbi:MAG: LEA type 2 family protein [Thiomonas sp.]|nr:LEA type 2 family protein [Thiomonas sp.]